MKKLLLLGALVISANTFSAASIVGGGLNINVGANIMGATSYNMGTGTNTVTATGGSTISAGNKFIVPAGGTLNIVTDSGTVQTYTGPTTVTLTSPLNGGVTSATIASVASTGATPTTPTTPSTPSTPSTPTTPTTPVAPSTPTTTPTTGTIPTVQGARSRVDYDLTKVATANSFKDLEQAKKENGFNLNIQYLF